MTMRLNPLAIIFAPFTIPLTIIIGIFGGDPRPIWFVWVSDAEIPKKEIQIHTDDAVLRRSHAKTNDSDDVDIVVNQYEIDAAEVKG